MQLYPHQNKAVTRVRTLFREGKKRVVLSLPTGGGKTACFSYMATEASKKGRRVLILTDRQELLSQSGNTVRRFNVRPHIHIRGVPFPEEGGIIICMVKSFANLAKKDPYLYRFFDMVIVDECHRGDFRPVVEQFDKSTFILGATATPISANKKFPLYEQYNDIVDTIGVSELIELEKLVKPITYSTEIDKKGLRTHGDDYTEASQMKVLDKRKLYTKLIDKYKELALGERTICFCVNREHSRKTADMFNEAGISARHVDANTPEREAIFKAHQRGEFEVLCNVGIATAGYDDPKIECVIVNLITNSLTKWLQMVGRGGRTSEGKDKFILMDMGANWSKLGLWEDERDWSYLFHNPVNQNQGIAPRKLCPKCEAIILASAKVCEFCDYEIPAKKLSKKELEQEFKEVLKQANRGIRPMKMDKVPRERWGSLTMDELVDLYRSKTYELGWVLRVLANREDGRAQIKEFAKRMGYKFGWVKRMFKQYNI